MHGTGADTGGAASSGRGGGNTLGVRAGGRVQEDKEWPLHTIECLNQAVEKMVPGCGAAAMHRLSHCSSFLHQQALALLAHLA